MANAYGQMMPGYGGYGAYPVYGTPAPVQVTPQTYYQAAAPQTQYMIYVDGEMGARAWQMPPNLPPNTVIPLYDLDGIHVYFRSVDQYGRVNPLGRARIVMEEAPRLPEGVSGNAPDMSQYATKDDMTAIRNEIGSLKQMLGQNRQNGRNPVQGTAKDGRDNA